MHVAWHSIRGKPSRTVHPESIGPHAHIYNTGDALPALVAPAAALWLLALQPRHGPAHALNLPRTFVVLHHGSVRLACYLGAWRQRDGGGGRRQRGGAGGLRGARGCLCRHRGGVKDSPVLGTDVCRAVGCITIGWPAGVQVHVLGLAGEVKTTRGK